MTEYDPGQVRFEHGRPVAVGDQPLATPTQVVTTPAGTWALYAVGDGALLVHPGGAVSGSAGDVAARLRSLAGGDEGGDEDREAAATLLGFVSDEGPSLTGTPPGPAAPGQAAGYHLSGPRNVPGGHTGTASGSSEPGAPPA